MGYGLIEILEKLGGEKRIHYALDHFQEALKYVGVSLRPVKSLVIAGTNGKGSTTLLISACLNEHGFSVRTFLSPHLQDPRERFLYGLVPCASLELDILARELEPVADKFHLTYFEFLTLIFFVWNDRNPADYLVLEVGLGGRLDATNVTTPLACVLTNISFDHQAYLGNSLSAILKEKLGVVPRGGNLFTGVREPELLCEVRDYCESSEITLHLSSQISTRGKTRNWTEQETEIDGSVFHLTSPSPAMLENASLAYQFIRSTFPDISMATIQKAFARIINPGRMEVVQENPRVILSGDHNPAGIDSLKAALKLLPYTKFYTVCAFSPDKPMEWMFKELAQISEQITLTEVRKLSSHLPDRYRGLTPHFEADAVKAVTSMIAKCPKDGTVLITGSLYLIGEVRTLWHSKVRFLKN